MSYETIFTNTTVESGSVNDSFGGQSYQMDTFLSILCKSNLNFTQFGVATELVEFGVFDDAVADIENYGKICLQCKWKKNPTDFELDDFFSPTNNRSFYLPKYFASFLKIKELFPQFNMFLIICNKTLPVSDTDIATVNDQQSNEFTFYKTQTNDEIFGNLDRFMIGSADPIEFDKAFISFKANLIASEIIRCASKCTKLDYICLKNFKKILMENIFDHSGNFHQDFLDAKHQNELTASIYKILDSKFVELRNLKLSHIIDIYNAFECDDQELDKLERETDEHIEIFLNQFYLIVDVTLEDLDKQIAENLKNEFNLENVDYIKSYVRTEIFNWIHHITDGDYLGKSDLENLYSNIKSNISAIKIVDRTSSVFRTKEIPPEYKQIDKYIQSFLPEYSTNTKQRILNIKCTLDESYLIACKIYQLLKTRKSDSYMFLGKKLSDDQFLEAVDVFQHFDSFKCFVVMVSRSDEIFSKFRTDLLKIVNENPLKKLIIISDAEIKVDISDVLNYNERSVKLIDLAEDSINRILNRPIDFQGKNISFREIMPTSLYQEISVQKLQNCKSFGNSVVNEEVYDCDLYIDRTIKNVLISKNIPLTNPITSKNIFTLNEDDFKYQCERNPQMNVHFLEKYDTKRFSWQRSRGCIEDLRKYLNKNDERHLSEEPLLKSTEFMKLLIIINIAGYGKTYLLNHLGETIKKKYPDHLVINIPLIKHIQYLRKIKNFQNSDSVIEFLTSQVLKIADDELKIKIFREFILKSGKVCILLDGHDEVAYECGPTVSKLLEILLEFPLRKVIVSTRPEKGEDLENQFNQFGFSLCPFQNEDQRSFLEKYWKKKFGVDTHKFTSYSNLLIKTLQKNISKEFTEVPFTLKLIAEIYSTDAYNQLNDPEPKIEMANLYKLFERYFNEKLKVYFNDKLRLDTENPDDLKKANVMEEEITKNCHRLAISKVFSNNGVKKYFPNINVELSESELKEVLKSGMISVDNKFNHNFLPEYFCFDYTTKNLEQYEIIDMIFKHILKKDKDKKLDILKRFFIKFCREKSVWKNQKIDTMDLVRVDVFIGFVIHSLSEFSDQKIIPFATWEFFLYYFCNPQTVDSKDDFETVKIIDKVLGLDFMKQLFQAKFNFKENPVKRNLLITSVDQDDSCLKVLRYLNETFKNDFKFVEEILTDENELHQNFQFMILNLITPDNQAQKINLFFEVLQIFQNLIESDASIKEFIEKLILKSDKNGQTLLHLMLERDVDVSKIREFLKWISSHLKELALRKIFKTERKSVFCEKVMLDESVEMAEGYLRLVKIWLKIDRNQKSLFDQFEEDLMNDSLSELFHQNQVDYQDQVKVLDLNSIDFEFVEYFGILGFNKKLKSDTFFAELVTILSKEDSYNFRIYFESKLDANEFSRTRKMLLNINKNFYQSALSLALRDKNLETFKFLIRFLPDEEIEIVRNVLYDSFQNYKDESNVLNLLKVSKGVNFTKKLLENQFQAPEKNLLFSSLNFNKNCLNLLQFCFQNLKNDQSIEQILNVRNHDQQNFIQIICSSGKDHFHTEQKKKLLYKIIEKFSSYGGELMKLLANLLFNPADDLTTVLGILGCLFSIYNQDFINNFLNLWVLSGYKVKTTNQQETFFNALELGERIDKANVEAFTVYEEISDKIFKFDETSKIILCSDYFIEKSSSKKLKLEFERSHPIDINFEDLCFSLKNFKEKENAIKLSKILQNKCVFPEICLIIEIYFKKKIKENDKLITDYFELGIGKDIKFLLYLLFDILIKSLDKKENFDFVRKILFTQIYEKLGYGFLHSLFVLQGNCDKELIGNIFEKLKIIKKYFPESDFKEFLLLKQKQSLHTFLSCIYKKEDFKIASDFLKSQFSNEFLKEIICCEDNGGGWIFNMTTKIEKIIFILEFLNVHFGQDFTKEFLLHKNNFQPNFLLGDDSGHYSDPSNSEELIKLFAEIFSIFKNDMQLFESLLKTKNENGNCFIKILKEKYKNDSDKLNKIKKWIRENLGRSLAALF
jgi:hypothetical protein